MGKVSATVGFRLFVGVAASTVIMAVGTMILARLLSPAEYGLYSMALIPSLMIKPFQRLGSFISRIISLPLGVAEKVAGISSAKKE